PRYWAYRGDPDNAASVRARRRQAGGTFETRPSSDARQVAQLPADAVELGIDTASGGATAAVAVVPVAVEVLDVVQLGEARQITATSIRKEAAAKNRPADRHSA
ncbi:hypothetical protein, partial [Streptomyces sp. NPDC048411]|uniref:hypothetical protein n=1 Tax=Streptomyces sp. NPDC048411 TaxID=3157206 RepID=UPI003453F1F7